MSAHRSTAVVRNGPGEGPGLTQTRHSAFSRALPEVALSSGSACTSAQPKPSHVIRALGRGGARALGAVRFGIGRANTEAEIDAVAALLVEQVERLRAMSPLWREPARASASRTRSRRLAHASRLPAVGGTLWAQDRGLLPREPVRSAGRDLVILRGMSSYSLDILLDKEWDG